MAMLFGFMSLGHGPIMTFAHAGKHDATVTAVQHHDGASHHGHGLGCDEPASEPLAADRSACNPFGCFITVGAADVEPPPQAMTPIGKLVPPPLPAALPGFTEPADPPPRLHG